MNKTAVAIRLFREGTPFKGSTSIDEKPSYGYGELDVYGFWEYPLPTKLVEGRRNILHMMALFQLKSLGKNVAEWRPGRERKHLIQGIAAGDIQRSCRFVLNVLKQGPFGAMS